MHDYIRKYFTGTATGSNVPSIQHRARCSQRRTWPFMNTITYLSRQFDVLTSARTPPSTPTAGSPSFSRQYPYPSRQDSDSDSDPSIKRVKTWSTKSFLFPPPTQSMTTPPPKRSFSSPTDFISFASVRPSLGSSSSETPISSKKTLKAMIRRIFFMRLFVLLCHLLSAAWFSVATKPVTEAVPEPIVDSSVSDSDSKDSDEEAKEKSRSSPQTLLPNPQPPMSRNAYIFRFHRSSAMNTMQESDLLSAAPPPMNTKQESDSLLAAPPSMASETVPFPTDSSRASTHVSNTQKSPFLLPKTLVLDLDETLIHSTSRALDSSVSSGSGLLGLSTFGRRNKGAGHMVEVVLGGRSTLYHVYKRPFVDFFLRTVCRPHLCTTAQLTISCPGLWVVYTCNIYCIHAGIC
jgi:CTD nuclear envelope phosphatase 1